MTRNLEVTTLRELLEMPEVSTWIAAHEREVDAFERRLRRVNPRAWQHEFCLVVLQSVEHDEPESTPSASLSAVPPV